jgi:hypothetical protein
MSLTARDHCRREVEADRVPIAHRSEIVQCPAVAAAVIEDAGRGGEVLAQPGFMQRMGEGLDRRAVPIGPLVAGGGRHVHRRF